jgi:lysyl-tRNA synthetase class 1
MGSQENQQTRTLDDVLAGFDVRTDPFDYHDVTEALRLLESDFEASGTAASPAMYAERLAFDFTENYHGDEGFEWDTYYGPVGVATDATGKRIEWPSLQEVTGETVAYWQTRAQAARHPLLRIRYADLAWEFGRRLKHEPGPEYPRIVIDATVEAAQKTLFEHTTRGFTALRRALTLALSL